jgi:hypothetical protein
VLLYMHGLCSFIYYEYFPNSAPFPLESFTEPVICVIEYYDFKGL